MKQNSTTEVITHTHTCTHAHTNTHPHAKEVQKCDSSGIRNGGKIACLGTISGVHSQQILIYCSKQFVCLNRKYTPLLVASINISAFSFAHFYVHYSGSYGFSWPLTPICPQPRTSKRPTILARKDSRIARRQARAVFGRNILNKSGVL